MWWKEILLLSIHPMIKSEMVHCGLVCCMKHSSGVGMSVLQPWVSGAGMSVLQPWVSDAGMSVLQPSLVVQAYQSFSPGLVVNHLPYSKLAWSHGVWL